MPSNFYNSANMNLPIPTIDQDPGPDYAANINAALTLVDSHNHSSGQGVQITPSGLNINSDLAFNGNNLILARSLRFSPQGSPLAGAADLGCLYESGVDLYYNDGSGNQVRITQSGGVAGSPGSIAGLSSPASATYVSANQTFVWQSAALTPANLDAASIIIRKLVASGHGITLSAPTAIASDYSLVLPPLPGSQKFMTLDASGNITAPWAVDGSTIVVSSNTVQVPAGGITTTQLADQSITQGKHAIRATGVTVAAGGVAKSLSSGLITLTSGSVTLANLTVTITSLGNPIVIDLMPDGTTSASVISIAGAGAAASIKLFNGASQIATWEISGSTTSTAVEFPPGAFAFKDFQSAGTYSYTMTAQIVSPGTLKVNNAVMTAYEL